MASPDWFDPAHYATQKVGQMNAIQYKSQTGWDLASYQNELTSFQDINGQPIPGETVEDKAYQNFLACNGSGYDVVAVAREQLNVSPNSYFDVSVYVANLAEYARNTNMPGAPAEGWTPESMLIHLYSDLRMSAWEHYTNVGMFAGINPSNAFDTTDYLMQRRDAMNSYENPDGSVGWQGNNSWTIQSVQQDLQAASLNPIMDFYDTGGETFHIVPQAPDVLTEVDADWTPWTVPPPYNAYDEDVKKVEMTAAQTAYTGEAGVNTRFEGHWGRVEDNTIAVTDTIDGGENAHNTLALTLDAPWAGFQGKGTTNVGRVELIHGKASPGVPYTFDARNMHGLERVDIEAGSPLEAVGDAQEATEGSALITPGTGAISLQNLGAGVKEVNIHDLGRMSDTQTQTTGIEFAEGVTSGDDDSLTIGLDRVGSDRIAGQPNSAEAPAPIALAGVEHVTLNAQSGNNYVNLQSVTGAETLALSGGGNIRVSSVPNGIRSYDASAASGRTNIFTSDLDASTEVKGGRGVDTITLTRDLAGTPAGWSDVEALAVSRGVSVDISAANISGLRELLVDTAKDVSISDLNAPGSFSIVDSYNGSRGNISVTGDIDDLIFSNADYASFTGASIAPQVRSNVNNNVIINAVGAGTFGGNYIFADAGGRLGIVSGAESTLGNVAITAPQTSSLDMQIAGKLTDGARIQAVDNTNGGSISINAANGIAAPAENSSGQLVLDADGATSMTVTTGGNFKLASNSSLSQLQSLILEVDGEEASFDASWMTSMPDANLVTVSGGGDVALPVLGSPAMTRPMQVIVDDANYVQLNGIQTGSNGNIVADIKANGQISLGAIATADIAGSPRGDVHLTLEGTDVVGYGSSGASVSGADIFMNLAGITGNAFAGRSLALLASESINYTGSDGDDDVLVAKVGSAVPSTLNLGIGSDSLRIGSSAVPVGQQVTMTVGLGADDVRDSLFVGSQIGRLGLYVEDFHPDEDSLEGFTASNITRAQGQALLSSFGVANTSEGSLQLLGFGSGNGVLYDGNLYAFNDSLPSLATTMVVLAGVRENVPNLIPVIPDTPPDGAEDVA